MSDDGTFVTDHKQHPFRPLFVEVPRELPDPRFGALDMTGIAPLYKALYAQQVSATPVSGPPKT